MSETATPLPADAIVQAIRDHRIVRLGTPTLEGAQYYADRNGHIYSLNNPAEPKEIEPKEGSGLMWVVLYQSDGRIGRFMVGDLIAQTFLDPSSRQLGEDTVTYRDGNPRNNSVDNLAWATRHEQGRQLRALSEIAGDRSAQEQGAAAPVGGPQELAKAATQVGEAAVSLPVPKAKDPVREEQLRLERALAEAEKRIGELEGALAPFAGFTLSPKHRIAPGSAPVFESNGGTEDHSVIRVHDFRMAAAAMGQDPALEGRDG